MIIEQELQQQITRALSGELSLDDLYRWLMDRSWNMHQDSLPSAVALAASVEALFFDRGEGLIDDQQFRMELAKRKGQ